MKFCPLHHAIKLYTYTRREKNDNVCQYSHLFEEVRRNFIKKKITVILRICIGLIKMSIHSIEKNENISNVVLCDCECACVYVYV